MHRFLLVALLLGACATLALLAPQFSQSFAALIGCLGVWYMLKPRD